MIKCIQMYSINEKLSNHGYTGRENWTTTYIFFYRKGMIRLMEYIVSISYFLITTISKF